MKTAILIIGLFLITISCSSNRMELSIERPNTKLLKLKIDNFPNFTVIDNYIDILQPEITMNEINETIFNTLKSEVRDEDTCEIWVNSHYIDGYGNKKISKYYRFGGIDLKEFKKFKSSEYWIGVVSFEEKNDSYMDPYSDY